MASMRTRSTSTSGTSYSGQPTRPLEPTAAASPAAASPKRKTGALRRLRGECRRRGSVAIRSTHDNPSPGLRRDQPRAASPPCAHALAVKLRCADHVRCRCATVVPDEAADVH